MSPLLESISGHLSRRMLEHHSHIRIDAKRQALDALDAARRLDGEMSEWLSASAVQPLRRDIAP